MPRSRKDEELVFFDPGRAASFRQCRLTNQNVTLLDQLLGEHDRRFEGQDTSRHYHARKRKNGITKPKRTKHRTTRKNGTAIECATRHFSCLSRDAGWASYEFRIQMETQGRIDCGIFSKGLEV